MTYIKPDLKSLIWMGVGFLVLPKVISMVKG
jgi:hypothetical protein